MLILWSMNKLDGRCGKVEFFGLPVNFNNYRFQRVLFAISVWRLNQGWSHPWPKKNFWGPNSERKLTISLCFGQNAAQKIDIFQIFFPNAALRPIWVGHPWSKHCKKNFKRPWKISIKTPFSFKNSAYKLTQVA
jgi:hypothetical protein